MVPASAVFRACRGCRRWPRRATSRVLRRTSLSSIVDSSVASSMSSHTKTPTTDPISGNTMNTHSWPRAFGWASAKIAVARLRAGLTLVLSTGIVTRWMTARVSPAVSPPKPGANRRLVVDRTMNTNSAVKTISTTIAAPRPLRPSRSQPFDANAPALPAVAPAGDAVDHGRPEDAAEHLGDPGVHGMAERDLPGQPHRQRDRRVDVAPADRSDDVGHDQQGEAEGEGHAEVADLVVGEDRRARTEHDEHGRADELGGGDRA